MPFLFHSGFCLLRADGRVRFDGFYLVLQYLEGGQPILQDVDSTKWVSHQILSKGVAHGDVRLQNTINHRIFMIDFGFSTSLIYIKGDRGARSTWGRSNSQLMKRDDEKLELMIQEAC